MKHLCKTRLQRVVWGAMACVMLFGAAGCACSNTGTTPDTSDTGPRRYEEMYYDVFDTSCTFMAYTETEEEFNKLSEEVHTLLKEYHELYDIYNTYDDKNNLRTVNDAAGKQAVAVDDRILDLVEFGKEIYTLSSGRVNIAYGKLLAVWHTRLKLATDEEDPVVTVPPESQLVEAAEHCSIDDIVIDREKGTLYVAHEQTEINVGAIAKGYAAQRVMEVLRKKNLESAALNMGGNVCVMGYRHPEAKNDWLVGIADPDESDYCLRLGVRDMCVATSGDYERYYEADGVRYHHIIDPTTNYPAKNFRAVSVVCADSGLADALSTALFVLPLDEGKALIEKTEGAEAMWILPDGKHTFSTGFEAYIVPDEENEEQSE